MNCLTMRKMKIACTAHPVTRCRQRDLENMPIGIKKGTIVTEKQLVDEYLQVKRQKKKIEARYKELGDQIKAGGARIVDNRLTIVDYRRKGQIDISALATAFGLTNAQLDKFRRQPITGLAIYEIPMVSAAASRSAPIGVEKTDFHEDEASLWEEQEEEKKRVEWEENERRNLEKDIEADEDGWARSPYDIDVDHEEDSLLHSNLGWD